MPGLWEVLGWSGEPSMIERARMLAPRQSSGSSFFDRLQGYDQAQRQRIAREGFRPPRPEDLDPEMVLDAFGVLGTADLGPPGATFRIGAGAELGKGLQNKLSPSPAKSLLDIKDPFDFMTEAFGDEPYIPPGTQAELPLEGGRMTPLDMSPEGRAARAKQGGFDLDYPYFHATAAPVDFPSFRQNEYELGIHMGTPGQAKERLQQTGVLDYPLNQQVGPRTLPLAVRARNPLRLPDLGRFSSDRVEEVLADQYSDIFDEESIADALYGKQTEPQKIEALRDLIEEKGYDSIIYENTAEIEGITAARKEASKAAQEYERALNWGDEEEIDIALERLDDAKAQLEELAEFGRQDSLAVLRPNQIRSIFAQFDPRKFSSDDILASWAALALGGGLTGSAVFGRGGQDERGGA